MVCFMHFVASLYICIDGILFSKLKCNFIIKEQAPPRPPLPYDGAPMRPPPPETDDEDEVFKTAPNASQPIMVSENLFRFILSNY